MVDLMVWTKELDGGLRRADGAKVRIARERDHASNREEDEYQESGGKLKEEIGEREVVCSSLMAMMHSWRISGQRRGRVREVMVCSR
jgi:hypothetical protein